MNLTEIVVALVLVGIVALIIRSMVKDRRAGKSLSCGSCKGCSGGKGCTGCSVDEASDR